MKAFLLHNACLAAMAPVEGFALPTPRNPMLGSDPYVTLNYWNSVIVGRGEFHALDAEFKAVFMKYLSDIAAAKRRSANALLWPNAVGLATYPTTATATMPEGL